MSRVAAAVLSAAALAFFALPLLGIVVTVPWADVAGDLASTRVLEALALSVVVSLSAVALAVVFGLPLAALLARRRRGRNLLRAVVALPLVLPPVVAGVGLLLALGRNGFAGRVLALAGIELPFTTAGAVAAATFVAAPFFVLAVEAGFASVDPLLVDAARSLGASRALVWRTVVLPALAPSLRAGLALAFARALGEFGATITFAGSYEGRTETLPLLVYDVLNESAGRAALLSLLLVVAGGAALVGLRAWPSPSSAPPPREEP